MLRFPCAKINIGLRIINKREDGFHNIETLFYPIPLRDSLEIIVSDHLDLNYNGVKLDCTKDENLVIRAYQLLKKYYDIPPVHIILRKRIPTGAGLGGGSSDAAMTLKILNELFHLELKTKDLCCLGQKLGADVPCFMYDTPTYGTGIGEVLTPLAIPEIDNKYLCLLLPGIHVSTVEAYTHVIPNTERNPLKKDLLQGLNSYRMHIENDFEQSVFESHPSLHKLKEYLYEQGAVYVSMSGSGSSIFGIFEDKPDLKGLNVPYYEMKLK